MDDEVEFWGQSMPREWMDYLLSVQEIRNYSDDEGTYKRIPYGSESLKWIPISQNTPCRHCNTILGKLHEPDCDYEQCPKCKQQKMTCDCDLEETA